MRLKHLRHGLISGRREYLSPALLTQSVEHPTHHVPELLRRHDWNRHPPRTLDLRDGRKEVLELLRREFLVQLARGPTETDVHRKSLSERVPRKVGNLLVLPDQLSLKHR